MKLALVGYGQMGHMLRAVAEKRGHKVVLTVDPFAEDADFKPASPAETAAKIKEAGAEGIIEFSHPTSVMGNIEAPFAQLEVFFRFGLLHGADQPVIFFSAVVQLPEAGDHLTRGK